MSKFIQIMLVFGIIIAASWIFIGDSGNSNDCIEVDGGATYCPIDEEIEDNAKEDSGTLFFLIVGTAFVLVLMEQTIFTDE